MDRPKIVILGSGPNRIGQGIEFDYCCCHAAFALKEDGFETIMVNCNPETVSTDYDTADRLYFEPAHTRRRSRRPRQGKSRARRDRTIWRADASESGSRFEAQRRENYWHGPGINWTSPRTGDALVLCSRNSIFRSPPRRATALAPDEAAEGRRGNRPARAGAAEATFSAGGPW